VEDSSNRSGRKTECLLIIYTPSPGAFRPTVVDKGWPIESIGSRLCDHARTFDSGVRARSNFRRTSPGEGITGIHSALFILTFSRRRIFNSGFGRVKRYGRLSI